VSVFIAIVVVVVVIARPRRARAAIEPVPRASSPRRRAREWRESGARAATVAAD
jgi:hypothetical protein